MLDDDVILDIAQSYSQLKDRVNALEQELVALSEHVSKMTEAVRTLIKCVVK